MPSMRATMPSFPALTISKPTEPTPGSTDPQLATSYTLRTWVHMSLDMQPQLHHSR